MLYEGWKCSGRALTSYSDTGPLFFLTSLSSTQYILKSKPVNHVEIQSLLIIMAAIPNLTNENQLMGSWGLETLNNLEKSLKEHSVAGK